MSADTGRAINAVNETLAGRTWGDGGNDQRVHVIEYISYAEDRIICRCGRTVTGISNGRAWSRHGGSLFSGRGFEDVGDIGGFSAQREAYEAVATILDMQRACTCYKTPVTECPNYLEGDEA